VLKYDFAMFCLSSSSRRIIVPAAAKAAAAAAGSSRRSAAAFLSRRGASSSWANNNKLWTRRNHVNGFASLHTRKTRLFSTTSDEDEPPPPKPAFDAEMSRMYKIIAENHRHPSGPWVTMLDKIHDYTNNDFPDETGGAAASFRALDLATGPGEPAETIARQFPNSTVVATDLSPDQVQIAHEKTLALPHMTAQVADMENLVDFEDNSFDVITCCYGFMFPPDKQKAVKEAYRVLKPGGILIATTWNKVGMMAFLGAVMTDVLGEAPPPPPVNPMSLKEPGAFESLLQEAGFDDIQGETHEYPFDMTKDSDFQFKGSLMLVKDQLDKLDAWDTAKEAFERHKLDFGAYNDNGHWMIVGNEYKLTVCRKATIL
jgi:SAM-dependent methyltransferase